MTLTLEQIQGSPNALAAHYTRFDVGSRLLLTGHSHQAWPDRAFEGQKQAWRDAAAHVDQKWPRAFARAEQVAAGFARLLDDQSGHVALGASTHDLLIRFLSALPLGERPRLVTTDGEFHTIRRQLDRLAEEGVEVVRVPSEPTADVSQRLAAEIDGRTSAALVSAVFYNTAQIATGLDAIASTCRAQGAELLVDAYHALGVVPFSLRAHGIERAFVTGGGYKYLQLGEGNCFLRFPEDCQLRPVATGWFSEFATMESPPGPGETVRYGEGPARFAGATYDPTSHYRASEVFGFFEEQGLTPELLRRISQHQIGLLATAFDALDLDAGIIDRDRSVPLERVAGFLVLRSARANEISGALAQRGVSSDFRGRALRLGPAPYLSDRQLSDAIGILGEVVRAL
jgi:selenocysteine lyase/cysteine desulfurase